MKMMLNYRTLAIIAFLLVCTADALARQAEGEFRETLDIDEPVVLDVATGSGSITVRAGASNRVEVVGKIKVNRKFGRSAADAEAMVRQFEQEPPVEIVDGQLRVGHIEDRNYQRNVTISYEIEVPAGTEVKSHTGSGAQELFGVNGPVEVSSGSGSLTLKDIGGAVDASTGSGRIRADGIAGDFRAHSGSGSIRLLQVAPGDVDVSTGSGSSELIGIVGTLDAHSGSGRITVEGTQNGAWRLDTGSGNIEIRLPEDAAFDLDAKTNSGAIDTQHPVTVTGRQSARRLTGQSRGGGSLLFARSGSGHIRIK
jgi:hypothetical protein